MKTDAQRAEKYLSKLRWFRKQKRKTDKAVTELLLRVDELETQVDFLNRNLLDKAAKLKELQKVH